MSVDMSGKNVIVTGAGGFIGRATCLALAQSGANLVIVDRDEGAANETLATVTASGGQAIVVVADVTREDDVRRYVDTAVSEFGTIDGFHNNAGIEGEVTPTAELAADDFDRVISVNLRGMFLGMRYVLPVMSRQGYGAIVCTGSIASVLGLANTVAYNAAKHGVVGIMRTAATEVAQAGVRVNAVLPGMIDSRMMDSLAARFIPGIDVQEASRIAAKGASPMARLGRPEEIANVVRFLLSDEASFMTGAAVAVDGGTSATTSNNG